MGVPGAVDGMNARVAVKTMGRGIWWFMERTRPTPQKVGMKLAEIAPDANSICIPAPRHHIRILGVKSSNLFGRANYFKYLGTLLPCRFRLG